MTLKREMMLRICAIESEMVKVDDILIDLKERVKKLEKDKK